MQDFNASTSAGLQTPSAPSENNPDATGRRAEIDRTNAQHSTGPRTEAGKQRSSLNALRHGLTGQVIVLPSEDLDAYQRHTRRLFDEFQPKTAYEELLVQSLADVFWRLNRIASLETNLLALGFHEQSDKVDTAHPEAHAALAMAMFVREQSRAISNLSMHGQRLSRERERTLKELREFQAERRERENAQMENASQILQMHKAEGISYNPAEDGFVFSTDEIETDIRRKQRLQQAARAHFRSCA